MNMAESAMERLQAENAAMREVLKRFAKGPATFGFATMYLCNYCDVCIGGIFGRTDHRANCPVAKAQAVLAEIEKASATQ